MFLISVSQEKFFYDCSDARHANNDDLQAKFPGPWSFEGLSALEGPAKKNKFVVITKGRQVGIFENWLRAAPFTQECMPAASVYMSFERFDDAYSVYKDCYEMQQLRLVEGYGHELKVIRQPSPIVNVASDSKEDAPAPPSDPTLASIHALSQQLQALLQASSGSKNQARLQRKARERAATRKAQMTEEERAAARVLHNQAAARYRERNRRIIRENTQEHRRTASKAVEGKGGVGQYHAEVAIMPNGRVDSRDKPPDDNVPPPEDNDNPFDNDIIDAPVPYMLLMHDTNSLRDPLPTRQSCTCDIRGKTLQESSPQAIVCVDACFTQKQNLGARDPPHSHPCSVFVPEPEVEKMECYVAQKRPTNPRPQKRTRHGEEDEGCNHYEGPLQVPKSVLDDCEASFTVADDRREKASIQFFDDTALMALVCRHDVVLFLAN
ncbi:hypothetical protein H0H93_007164, partial [Arthromyces matolae]